MHFLDLTGIVAGQEKFWHSGYSVKRHGEIDIASSSAWKQCQPRYGGLID
jgi:hypothetical protein